MCESLIRSDPNIVTKFGFSFPETSTVGQRIIEGIMDAGSAKRLSEKGRDGLNAFVLDCLKRSQDSEGITEHKNWLVGNMALRMTRKFEQFVADDDETKRTTSVIIPLIDDEYVHWSAIEPVFRHNVAHSLANYAGLEYQAIAVPELFLPTDVTIGNIRVKNILIPDHNNVAQTSDFKFIKL